MAVNIPSSGADMLIVVVTGVSDPCAQFGTHPWMSETPVPVALSAVQEDQVMPVTMLPPSPEKPMTDGSIPR